MLLLSHAPKASYFRLSILWRTRGLSDLAPIGIAKGSFDWLVQEFKNQQKWKDVDPHTQRTYEQGQSSLPITS